jgi:hypothetical protein
MRRVAILSAAALTASGFGVLASSTPAHADAPYVSESVILDAGQQAVPGNLVGLCLTIRELNSGPNCIHI